MTLQEAPNASSGVEAHHKVVYMFSITVTVWQRSLAHAYGRVVTQGHH